MPAAAIDVELVRVESDQAQRLRGRLKQAPSALKVSALVVLGVLMLAHSYVNEPVVKGQDKVHASIMALCPVKPHRGFALESQARGLQKSLGCVPL